jgi:hypothetical protein
VTIARSSNRCAFGQVTVHCGISEDPDTTVIKNLVGPEESVPGYTMSLSHAIEYKPSDHSKIQISHRPQFGLISRISRWVVIHSNGKQRFDTAQIKHKFLWKIFHMEKKSSFFVKQQQQ